MTRMSDGIPPSERWKLGYSPYGPWGPGYLFRACGWGYLRGCGWGGCWGCSLGCFAYHCSHQDVAALKVISSSSAIGRKSRMKYIRTQVHKIYKTLSNHIPPGCCHQYLVGFSQLTMYATAGKDTFLSALAMCTFHGLVASGGCKG